MWNGLPRSSLVVELEVGQPLNDTDGPAPQKLIWKK